MSRYHLIFLDNSEKSSEHTNKVSWQMIFKPVMGIVAGILGMWLWSALKAKQDKKKLSKVCVCYVLIYSDHTVTVTVLYPGE